MCINILRTWYRELLILQEIRNGLPLDLRIQLEDRWTSRLEEDAISTRFRVFLRGRLSKGNIRDNIRDNEVRL